VAGNGRGENGFSRSVTCREATACQIFTPLKGDKRYQFACRVHEVQAIQLASVLTNGHLSLRSEIACIEAFKLPFYLSNQVFLAEKPQKPSFTEDRWSGRFDTTGRR